jgi:hypothetical protein
LQRVRQAMDEPTRRLGEARTLGDGPWPSHQLQLDAFQPKEVYALLLLQHHLAGSMLGVKAWDEHVVQGVHAPREAQQDVDRRREPPTVQVPRQRHLPFGDVAREGGERILSCPQDMVSPEGSRSC